MKNILLTRELEKEEKRIKIGFFIIGVLFLITASGIIYLYLAILKKQNTPAKIFYVQKPAIKLTPSPNLSPTPSQTAPSTNLPANKSENLLVKDYFVPLGSGTNNTSEWTDVPGVQAIVDFGQYPNIKEVHFEASVYVPTANESVSLRLYNVTDKHPVWYSDVTMNGGSSASTSSPAIIFDKGEKIYQVQMKTQLQATANLVESRIHIILY